MRLKERDKMRKWLKALRKKYNLTQSEIANGLKISRNYYYYIGNGKRRKDLDLSQVLNLSKIFNVSVDYIINEESKLKQI